MLRAHASVPAPVKSAPFAKNRDFRISCACTVVEGVLSGSNVMLIWLVMRQVFSDSVDPGILLRITATLVVVFAARLAVYRFGYVRGQVGGARVSRNLRIIMGESIKRIPLSRFTERTSGEYLQALTTNVNDYEQILTHRTGEIIKSAVLAAVLSAFRAAIPRVRRRMFSQKMSSRYARTGRPRSRPESGIAFAELGQQTASGISFTGVKQSPPCPVDSFTPEKNRPKTALSTVISSSFRLSSSLDTDSLKIESFFILSLSPVRFISPIEKEATEHPCISQIAWADTDPSVWHPPSRFRIRSPPDHSP